MLYFADYITTHSVCRLLMFPSQTSRMISKSKVLVFLLFFTGIGVYVKTGYQLTHYAVDQKLCACIKCLSEDKQLLLDRSNRSVQPFLTANLNLSQNEFNWWKVSSHQERMTFLHTPLQLIWSNNKVYLKCLTGFAG